jgi:hypothetical protein
VSWTFGLPAEPTALAVGVPGVLLAGRNATSDDGAWVIRLDAAGAETWSRALVGDVEPTGAAWALDGHPVLVGGCRGSVDLGDGSKAAQGLDAFSADLAP